MGTRLNYMTVLHILPVLTGRKEYRPWGTPFAASVTQESEDETVSGYTKVNTSTSVYLSTEIFSVGACYAY